MQYAKSCDSGVKKNYGLYIHIPQFEYRLCQLSALQLWVSHLTFLSFSPLICQVEMRITSSATGCCEDQVQYQNSKLLLLSVAVVEIVRSRSNSDNRLCITHKSQQRGEGRDTGVINQGCSHKESDM